MSVGRGSGSLGAERLLWKWDRRAVRVVSFELSGCRASEEDIGERMDA